MAAKGVGVCEINFLVLHISQECFGSCSVLLSNQIELSYIFSFYSFCFEFKLLNLHKVCLFACFKTGPFQVEKGKNLPANHTCLG